ncbi:hypothetical protein [Rickettsia asembonensis]|uniref:hypothetical protein n=1 Tax=Rickettsia asembonensis TaxID=1068590 RepID=UPI0011BA66B7|nr:hypothetical protein [Rickettsia asembonensis]
MRGLINALYVIPAWMLKVVIARRSCCVDRKIRSVSYCGLTYSTGHFFKKSRCHPRESGNPY